MSLTVLSDDQVKAILNDLTLQEFEDFRHVLAGALHEFSTNTQAVDEEVFQQPLRITTRHPDTCATTLYMPSCGPDGMGCKVISLTTSDDAERPGVKPISPTGVVNLFAPDGRLTGIVNANNLTGFRTALASACLVGRRNHVRTITVFGSGLQAYWHVRLALLTRGSTVKHVYIINRRFSENAGQMLKKFTLIPPSVKEREGWGETKFSMLTPTFHDYDRLQKEQIRAADVIFCCTPSQEDLFDGSILTSHEGRRKGRLIVAVGSYKPGMRELPDALIQQATRSHERPHRHFHKHAEDGGVIVVDSLEGALTEAGEIITGNIGPKKLVELGELVMLHRLSIEESETESTMSTDSSVSEFDKLDINDRTPSMSTVFSDPTSPTSPTSRSASPSRSESPSRHKPSLPNLFKRSQSGGSSDHEKKNKEGALARWLRDGTVIYKSVGLGLMDLVVGAHLVKLAHEKQVGIQVDDF